MSDFAFERVRNFCFVWVWGVLWGWEEGRRKVWMGVGRRRRRRRRRGCWRWEGIGGGRYKTPGLQSWYTRYNHDI